MSRPPLPTLLATRNTGKLIELVPYLPELALSLPDQPLDVEETAATFEGNARLKAEALRDATGMAALADDSGLCVDALDGRPGVRSARYAESAEARNAKLLAELEGLPPERRTARFVCVLALAMPDRTALVARGELPGVIAQTPAGNGGFGYDPIFYLPDRKLTLAELPASEKARLSHRARAIAALREQLVGR